MLTGEYFGKRIKMGKYTVLDNPIVDESIDAHMKIITKEVVDRIKPESVILTGSFGRGEGSVILKNSEVKILSDYEMGVVTNKFWQRELLSRLSQKLSTMLGVETTLACITPHRLKQNRTKNLSFGRSLPSVSMYELKSGSILLYGKNYLSENLIDPRTIPLWEGISLLFNRIAEALQYFDVCIFQKLGDALVEDLNLIKWISKIVLACSDALLISVGKYHYSYRIRRQVLQQEYPEYFSCTFRGFPQFLPMVQKAYEFKLYGPKNSAAYTNRDTIKFWFDAVEICDKVFRFILQKDLGMNFRTYLEFPEKYLNHSKVRHEYNYYRLGPVYLPVYENLIYTVRMTRWGRTPPLRSLNKITIPWHHLIFSMIPVIFFSLSRDGRINTNMLQKARETMRFIRSLRPMIEDPLKEWEYLKKNTVRLWYYICYGELPSSSIDKITSV